MIKKFIYLTIFFFISLSAHADEWRVEPMGKWVHASKNGEVTHGDDLRFSLKKVIVVKLMNILLFIRTAKILY